MVIKHHHVDPKKTKRGRLRQVRAPGIPGRKSMASSQADEIRRRLRQFVTERVGSIYELVEAYGVSRSTAAAWSRAKSRAVPDVKSLEPLIAMGLSLDWLYTGRGSPLFVEAPSAADNMSSLVRAELHASDMTRSDEFEVCWRLLETYRPKSGPSGVLGFVGELVREFFSELMSLVGKIRDMERMAVTKPREVERRRLHEEADWVRTLRTAVEALGLPFDVDYSLDARLDALDRRYVDVRTRFFAVLLDQVMANPATPAQRVAKEWVEREARGDQSAGAPSPAKRNKEERRDER